MKSWKTLLRKRGTFTTASSHLSLTATLYCCGAGKHVCCRYCWLNIEELHKVERLTATHDM